jgi:hypothetical protein
MSSPRRKPAPGRTTRGGWGWKHQQERARVKRFVDTGAARCVRCGGAIEPNSRWHLDHSDLPGSHRHGVYLGPSHAGCNVAAAMSGPRRPARSSAPALAFFNPRQDAAKSQPVSGPGLTPKSSEPGRPDSGATFVAPARSLPGPTQTPPQGPSPLSRPIPLQGLPSPLDTF